MEYNLELDSLLNTAIKYEILTIITKPLSQYI